MVFGIVLTMAKNMVSGLEAYCFWPKQLFGDCTAIAPIVPKLVGNSCKALNKMLFGVWVRDFLAPAMVFGIDDQWGKVVFRA